MSAERVGQYARRVGELMGLDQGSLAMLEAAGSLHDAGKAMLPHDILSKPAPLEDDEWEEMMRHPELGAEVAEWAGHPDEVADMVRHHHERIDGQGYPDRLAGEEIPLGARIIAVIDAYMGMTSKRPYRDPLPPRQALDELERGAGTSFDPDVVDTFVRLVRANLPGA